MEETKRLQAIRGICREETASLREEMTGLQKETASLREEVTGLHKETASLREERTGLHKETASLRVCLLYTSYIGIITKVDSPHANVPMVRQWMVNAGCERIFEVNNVTREGLDELIAYLEEDLPKLSMEEAKFKQSLGLNEWDPLPDGVSYPE